MDIYILSYFIDYIIPSITKKFKIIINYRSNSSSIII